MYMLNRIWLTYPIPCVSLEVLTCYFFFLYQLFFCQTCVPAIFPPLKDIYPGNIADDLQGTFST